MSAITMCGRKGRTGNVPRASSSAFGVSRLWCGGKARQFLGNERRKRVRRARARPVFGKLRSRSAEVKRADQWVHGRKWGLLGDS
jgi:hypothetical protein